MELEYATVEVELPTGVIDLINKLCKEIATHRGTSPQSLQDEIRFALTFHIRTLLGTHDMRFSAQIRKEVASFEAQELARWEEILGEAKAKLISSGYTFDEQGTPIKGTTH